MAQKDGNIYYMKVILQENGESTVRRFHRLTWQDRKTGVTHVKKGKDLPSDVYLDTGTDQESEHKATFLGVTSSPTSDWTDWFPSKSHLSYVIGGAALAFVLEGLLILATQ
jgi:hypothetical protein